MVFLGLAGMLLGISLRDFPASLWKTPSVPPLLLGLPHYCAMFILIGSQSLNKDTGRRKRITEVQQLLSET